MTRNRNLLLLVPALLLLAAVLPLAAAGPQAAGRPDIKWGTEVDWKTWEEGSKLAEEEGKRMVLVVYADWCPRCRELAPVFKTPEIAALTEDLVMVLQDSDEKPSWLTKNYGAYGTYVPRIFFLEPDGTMIPNLTGGNEKYPYYYWPGNANLAANLKKAAKPAKK